MQIALGRYTGDGTDDRSITGLGFQPDFVAIKGGSASAIFKFSNHAGDTSHAFNGTIVAANYIQTMESDGFQIGTHARVNASGTSYDWMAVKTATADCSLLTYTGNGADDRGITGAGFQPSMVLLYGSGAYVPVWRTDTVSGDKSLYFGAVQTVADGIQALQADGFQVGTLANVNTNGDTYYALCVKTQSMAMETLTYTGDGADSRSITGAGFQPEAAWIAQEDTTEAAEAAVCKWSYQTGDTTHYFNNVAAAADLIQAFQSDGVQIGTNVSVNESGKTYHVVAWRTYGWVTPRQFAVNEVVTPEVLNTYVSGPLQWLKDNPFDTGNYGEAPLHAKGTANLALGASWADILGGSVALNGTGEWIITASIHFQLSGISTSRQFHGQLLIGGTAQAGTVRFELPSAAANADGHAGGLWSYDAASQPLTIKLQAYGPLRAAGDVVIGTDTSITAWRVSAP